MDCKPAKWRNDLSRALDDEQWPVELTELVSDPRFAKRVTAAARKRLGYVEEDEIFEGISSFVVRALEVREAESTKQADRNFLSRFPSSFSVVRYIVVSIHNARRKRTPKHEVLSPDLYLEVEEKNLTEDAIRSYLAQLSLNQATKTVADPAGLDQIEREVIRSRWEGNTLKQIAELLKVSISKVHRTEKEAIAKLRSWLFG